MDPSTAALVASIATLVIYWVWYRRRSNVPPGPFGYPVVGYLPFFSSKPYLDIQALAKKYGNVFSLQLGTENVVILNDFPSMKEAFAQDAFMGRPEANAFEFSKETLETGAFNKLPWKEQRKVSLHILRDLGFGKSHLEEMIKEEISDLLTHFEESAGRAICARPLLTPSMSNNIASLVYGRRLKYDDPVRIMLDKSVIIGSREAGQAQWKLFFPWLRSVTNFLKPFIKETELQKIIRDAKVYTRQEIKEHKRTLEEGTIRDYIDGYLLEIRKRNDPAFSNEVLVDMVRSFFGAGSETVRLTIEWILLASAVHPDVQKKVQKEIDNVIGRDRMPSYDDHPKMPYTEAALMETMRWRTIVPINLLRCTLSDTVLLGYFVPKDTYVFSNIWAVHHNPEYWGEDVEEFKPERFLTDNGTKILKSEYYMPFSMGKRACPGESFAKQEVFLYFAAILQKFNVSLPQGNVPDLEGELGIGLSPKTYEICFNKRQ